MKEFERLQARGKSTRVYLRFVGMERFVDAAMPDPGTMTTMGDMWEKPIEYRHKMAEADVMKSMRNLRYGMPTSVASVEDFRPQTSLEPSTATFLVQMQCVEEELADLTEDLNLIFKSFLITFFLVMIYGFFCSSYAI